MKRFKRRAECYCLYSFHGPLRLHSPSPPFVFELITTVFLIGIVGGRLFLLNVTGAGCFGSLPLPLLGSSSPPNRITLRSSTTNVFWRSGCDSGRAFIAFIVPIRLVISMKCSIRAYNIHMTSREVVRARDRKTKDTENNNKIINEKSTSKGSWKYCETFCCSTSAAPQSHG